MSPYNRISWLKFFKLKKISTHNATAFIPEEEPSLGSNSNRWFNAFLKLLDLFDPELLTVSTTGLPSWPTGEVGYSLCGFKLLAR